LVNKDKTDTKLESEAGLLDPQQRNQSVYHLDHNVHPINDKRRTLQDKPIQIQNTLYTPLLPMVHYGDSYRRGDQEKLY